MKTYFFGDIHGNLPALEACLAHAEALKVDEIICLGDLVGWLPFGDRTLKKMLARNYPAVAGNHDLLVASQFPDRPEKLDRIQATAYNAGLLSTIDGAVDYLNRLPLKIERDDFTVVHHSPFHLPDAKSPPSIEHFGYLDETVLSGILDEWAVFPKPLIVSGHDHVAAVYELPEKNGKPDITDVVVHRPDANRLRLALKPTSRYWIKAGSVGGPYRDHFTAANSVLYDTSSQSIEMFRLPYPAHQLKKELAAMPFFQNIATIHHYTNLL